MQETSTTQREAEQTGSRSQNRQPPTQHKTLQLLVSSRCFYCAAVSVLIPSIVNASPPGHISAERLGRKTWVATTRASNINNYVPTPSYDILQRDPVSMINRESRDRYMRRVLTAESLSKLEGRQAPLPFGQTLCPLVNLCMSHCTSGRRHVDRVIEYKYRNCTCGMCVMRFRRVSAVPSGNQQDMPIHTF